MLISQVIELARGGEIKNLSDDSFDDATILGYVNLGLIELYKRFSLRTEEAIVTMRDSKVIYTLDDSDVDVDIDLTHELMLILEAYDESGAFLNINVENDELGILTPSYDTIQVPNPAEGEKLGILYLAGPDWVTDINSKLKAPVSLLEALLHYIGYRAHGSVDGNIDAENNTHYKRFEASVARAKTLGLVTADDIQDRDVRGKGFI